MVAGSEGTNPKKTYLTYDQFLNSPDFRVLEVNLNLILNYLKYNHSRHIRSEIEFLKFSHLEKEECHLMII